MQNQLKKQITVSQAGRQGGQSTLQKYGIKHFSTIGRKGGKRTSKLYRNMLSEFGKKGGRPRRPSLEEHMEEGDR